MSKFRTPATRDAEWERNHLYALFVDHVIGCGCNQPGAAYELVRGILDLTPFYEDGNWRKVQALIGTDGAFQIVLGVLTDADLLEHGGSMGGSWITPKGEYVRELMRRYPWDSTDGDDSIDPDGVDDSGYPECYVTKNGCPPEHWLAPPVGHG
jgi:hypothetical protein